MLKQCAVDITRSHHSQSIRPEDKVYAVESRIIYHATAAESLFEPCAIPGGRYRWTPWVASSASYSNCIVLQSMWNYAKDVDRARYGDEGKNSRRFASYEHIPLPVRDHAWRTTAETRRQLELNYVTQVASATNVNKWRR